MNKSDQVRFFLFCNALVVIGVGLIISPFIFKGDEKAIIDSLMDFPVFYAPTILICSIGSFLYRKYTLAILFLCLFAALQVILFLKTEIYYSITFLILWFALVIYLLDTRNNLKEM